MNTAQLQTRDEAKRIAVIEAAANVFPRYGFRRTTMNDVAEAAGISRPALYLMFENKEHLFSELVKYRLDLACSEATAQLHSSGPVAERFMNAVLSFERIFYEPIADSPHGAELMDANLSLKSDSMMDGVNLFIADLALSLEQAGKVGEIDLGKSPAAAEEFVALLFTSIGGIKKKASSGADFRRQVQQLTQIFLQTLSID